MPKRRIQKLWCTYPVCLLIYGTNPLLFLFIFSTYYPSYTCSPLHRKKGHKINVPMHADDLATELGKFLTVVATSYPSIILTIIFMLHSILFEHLFLFYF